MFRQSVVSLALAFALFGCDSQSSVPTTAPAKPVPAQISLTPLDAHVDRGDSLVLHALVLSTKSIEITDAVLEWSSSDQGIAMVNSKGVAYGLRQGTTTILARIGTVSAQVSLVVADPLKDVPSFLSLDVPQVLIPGEVGLLTGRVYNRFRERLTDSVVTWSSGDTTTATIATNGQVRAIRPGTAIMRAQSGSLTDSISLVVAPALPARIDGPRVFVPESQGFMQAVQPSPRGTTARFSGATWSSSDAAIATVDQPGVVTAHRQGSVTITALTDSGALSTQITVRSLPGRVVYGSGNRIISLALDGRDATEIVIEGVATPANPTLSFDGRALAFECPDACRVSLDAAHLVPERLGRGSEPSLSADGSAMLARVDPRNFVLYRGSGSESVGINAPVYYVGRSQLSPDGRSAIFECSYIAYDDPEDLCIIDESGRTSSLRASALRPAWSPDGLSIAYDATIGICVSSITPEQCTFINGYAAGGRFESATPAWSPDGQHLVIATRTELWLVDKNGDNLVRLLKATSVNSSPSWGAWAGIHP